MAKTKIIQVQSIPITVISEKGNDFICLTDMAKAKGGDARAADIIKNWIRTRTALEFIGTWEEMYNPGFKVVEFDHFKMQAGLLNMALFGKTAVQWRNENPKPQGNIRDDAALEQLVVLTNLESLNAVWIEQGIPSSDRLLQLNKIAIQQLKTLSNSSSLKKLY